MKKAIVTGVTGQVGSYMADYLLENTSYQVYGAIRRLSVKNHENIDHIQNERFHLVEMDLNDSESIENLIREIQPDIFINLAANSFVGTSWKMPVNHFQNNTLGVLHQLETIRKHCPKCRYYNAGSSEEWGDVLYSPQDEAHPLRPRSPYGASKAAARHIVKVWRESYDLFALQGHLLNHESPRRGAEFVTRKISIGVARIREAMRKGEEFQPIELGNLDAKRDWSHAQDFVEGIWLMMNQEKPKEYVLSSNESHTIREFVEKSFDVVGIKGTWSGEGAYEEYIFSNGQTHTLVRVNPDFYRPAEVNHLHGNSNLIRSELGWKPKYSFDDLVKSMVENDLNLIKNGRS